MGYPRGVEARAVKLGVLATALVWAGALAAGCSLLVESEGLAGGADAATVEPADGGGVADGAANDGGSPSGDGGLDATPDAGADADAATNPPCEIDSELALCLRFEGSLKDESSSDLAPASQANVSYEPGRHGQAARFELAQPATELTYANTHFGGARTIELWVKPVSTARMVLVDVRDDFALIIEANTLRCRQPELTATVALAMNAWNHVACATDHVDLRAYVNGQPAGTVASTNMTDNNGYTGIGQDSPTGSNRFEGWIDDVRIWKSTRTPQQIAESASR